MGHDADLTQRRVAALRRFDVLDVAPRPTQQGLARLATMVAGASTAVTALVDDSRVVPVAHHGCHPGVSERAGSLAAAVVATGAPAVLRHPVDGRFLADPVVHGLASAHVVAVPVALHELVLGALLVGAREPSARVQEQVLGLELVAAQVVADLELERTRVELALQLGTRNLHRRTDELTGLPDRRALFERASVEFARHRRHGTGVVVAVVDLDDFGTFDERCGVAAADLLLQRLARRLDESGRRADLVGRWAGDRFVLVAPDTPAEHAGVLLARVRAEVASVTVDGRGVTCSIGAATAGPGVEDFTDALRAAERQLAAVRAAGGDGIAMAGAVRAVPTR